MAHRRVEEARLALMLLTRLPVGRLAEPAPDLHAARWAFPLVGIPVGAVAAAILAVAHMIGMSALAAALLALAVGALLTGALHLDGLADFADGIGGGRDRAHCLDIMRDSRIGSYGVIALILALGLAATGLADVPPEAALAALLFAATGSRLAMLVVLDRLPPAREDGLGRSASGAAQGTWFPGALAVGVLAAWIGPASLPALAAMAAAASATAWLAQRRIGGQTGDVLGATQVASEVTCILALSASL
jgi:adenosylcobinamide-GDP ribazoletransferase